ncbi:trehalose synthase [Dyadobacter flavalbus]|uniref:Trehalose synthase n=1 Tax=Dyadobacter flavalbus TaxID=2579942 RepID=A0A5M8QDF8_9BACT|nr:alpha-amylase family protein [Dyadobacter flavalbus]KAA6432776.1 trehalose synthase [Dyadobacter flavalbus]
MLKPALNALLCLIFTIPLCQAQKTGSEDIVKDNLWFKNSVIYNLEIGVFKDSDGDGRGDFDGLVQKLDYLKTLGVDAIWLAPFQPSPGEDDGYDIADYYGIDRKFGNGGNFTEFMFQAKKRGIRVIMDLVINHTSDTHPWFQSARKDKNSKYRSWYIWSKELPKDWNKGMVFPGVQKGIWSFDSTAKEYYYHRFYDFQPDLNYNNPDVRQESQRVIGYWINQGIDGFRLDAVPFIIEVGKIGSENPELDFKLLKDMRTFAQWRKSDIVILGEANVEPKQSKFYFGENADGIHMMFNFFSNQHLFYALASGDLKPFVTAIKETQDIPKASQWANFLRNHDEIDLGRLTDKQREQVYKRMGPDTSMQLYDRGIRRRLAPMLGNRKQLELANSLLFSLPGAPVIRYGEEIGMGDDLSLKERLSVRTPMQWTNEKNAGFTTADTAFRPVINKGDYSYEKVNVAQQSRDPQSLLNWTTRIIKLRKECPEIGLGTYSLVESGSESILAIRYEYEGKSLVILHNFSSQPQKAVLSADKSSRLYDLMSEKGDVTAANGKFSLSMEGYGYKWFRVDHVIR